MPLPAPPPPKPNISLGAPKTIRYAPSDSPLTHLSTPQYLLTYFQYSLHSPCQNHHRQYLALFSICREFYDMRREENMRNLNWKKGEIRPRNQPLPADQVEQGLQLFGGDSERYRKMCELAIDSLDACLLHSFDSYARQCLDMHTIDQDKKLYHLRSCLRDRDINVLYKIMYQRTVRLLDVDPENNATVGGAPQPNMRGMLFKDISSYKSQCDILRLKLENCLINKHKDQCAAEEFKYVTCAQMRDCETEISKCGDAFSGAHHGDRAVSQWNCIEYGMDRDLGSAIPNIGALNGCLMRAKERAFRQEV